MKTYLVHLIRHGRNSGAEQGRYIGHTDLPLCEEGISELTALKNELVYPQVKAVISSPLKRCLETAKILYPENEPAVMTGFTECDFGEFEGLTAEELAPFPEFAEWLRGGEEASPLGGESGGAFKRRVLRDFGLLVQGLLKTGTESCALITHGGVIMTVLAAFGIPELPMHEWIMPYGHGYTLRITPSLWTRINKFEITEEIPIKPQEEQEEGEESDE